MDWLFQFTLPGTDWDYWATALIMRLFGKDPLALRRYPVGLDEVTFVEGTGPEKPADERRGLSR